MADYSHHHTYRVARAPHRASARRFGWVLAVAAVLMLAVLAWVWTQQRAVDTPLPRTAVAGPAAVLAVPAPAKPALIAPVPAPPSDAVAAAGDTRPVR